MSTEKTLAVHCSSVLLRKKPAALFRIGRGPVQSGEMDRIFGRHQLSWEILCDRCENVLVMVYDSQMLTQRLDEPFARRTLGKIGYPVGQGPQAMLRHLRLRIGGSTAFPHEIGFFLGYPAEDVLGFMHHKGKHCKHCGLWKVYSDVPRALAMFEEYRACRQHVLTHLENGGSLMDLSTELTG